jgi:hypothetical protein
MSMQGGSGHFAYVLSYIGASSVHQNAYVKCKRISDRVVGVVTALPARGLRNLLWISLEKGNFCSSKCAGQLWGLCNVLLSGSERGADHPPCSHVTSWRAKRQIYLECCCLD